MSSRLKTFTTSAVAALAVLACTAGGCVGSAITNQGGRNGNGGTLQSASVFDMSINAKAEFESKVQLLLVKDCGVCHAQANGSYPPFLVAGPGSDVYSTFIAWPNLVGATPATSLILTKEAHEGPSFADTKTPPYSVDKPVISQWITDYNNAGGSQAQTDMGVLPHLTPVAPKMGVVNTLSLYQLGSKYGGMTLTFTPTMVGDSLISISDITLNATKTMGIHVEGTVVAFYNASDLTDTQTIDTDFNTVGYDAYEGGTSLLGTTIPSYTKGQYIGFSFTTVKENTGMPDMAGGASMCKDVADFSTFKKNLTGDLQTNKGTCISCHNNGGAGNSAFNMGGFTDATMDAASCATMLLYVNPATPNQSDCYRQISGQSNHQGGTLSTADQATFLSSLTTWLTKEQ